MLDFLLLPLWWGLVQGADGEEEERIEREGVWLSQSGRVWTRQEEEDEEEEEVEEEVSGGGGATWRICKPITTFIPNGS